MPKSTLPLSALSGNSTGGEDAHFKTSLYDHKDEFIGRISPVATAAIYFGSFSLEPQDISLSRQALFKLSFLHRHFLHLGGLRVNVDKQTAILSGTLTSRILFVMGETLARQIDGIRQVKDETTSEVAVSAKESIQFLFATDQTLRSGVQVSLINGHLTLEGEVRTAAQRNWAEQLAEASGAGVIDSKLKIATLTPSPMTPVNEPPQLDDESLQALVLFRLRLVRETEHVPVKVKANRGVVTLQGKVRNEALRQRVENISRSTLGTREMRSTLSVAG